MGKIRINADLYYPPGPWGLQQRVANATVDIIDKDAPGRGDDVIWSGTSDSRGHLEGQSSDWQDSVSLPELVCDEYKTVLNKRICIRSHWSTQAVPDLSDVRVLVARIRHRGWDVTVPYPYLSDQQPTIPLVAPPPFEPPPNLLPVLPPQRSLVLVNHLVGPGPDQWRRLYEFMNVAGPTVASQILSQKYSTLVSLVGPQATRHAFLQALNAQTTPNSIRAVDTILNLHGSADQVVFADGSVHVRDLKDQLLQAGRGKLRMLYSTACYGASHADRWLAGGYRVVAGARAVNANSMIEYPTVLSAWGNGATFELAIDLGEREETRIPMDDIARGMGFTDVNSDKTVTGSRWLTLSSPPS